MVEYLEQHHEAPVHDLADYVSLPPAATSQHLNHMKRLGLVASDRKGKEVWYAIADRRCISILNCIRAKGRKQSHG
jgi:ArsR family transcriptional regulator